MEAKLVVVGGAAAAGEYQLTLPTVVGRSRRADLKLGHPLVSRQNCELYEADGVLMVRDMGSLNGTFVGDSRITIETALEPGDLLTIGSVTFRAVYGGASDLPQSEQPAAEQAKSAATSKQAQTKKPAGEKKNAAQKPAAATDKPAEIDQTQQAGGLAALEQLRDSGAEDEPGGIVAQESSEDFNFNWLEDSQPETESAPTPGIETEEEPEADVDDAEEAPQQPGSMTLDLGDQDVEVEDPSAVDPAKAAEEAEEESEEAASDAAVEETQTVRVEKPPKGQKKAAPAPPAKPEVQPAAEEADLDDFFKSLE